MTVWPARTLKSDCLALGFVFMCEAIASHPVDAQQLFRWNPSIGVTEVYDSNLFFTQSDRQGDSIWRVSPAIEPEYRSTPWTWLGRFGADAERFADHAELNTVQARAHASSDLRYHPTPRLTLGAATDFSTTQMPGEFNVETALTVARASARRLAVHPSATYAFGAVTEGKLDYSYTDDRLAGSPRLRAQVATLGLERHVSPRDTASLSYGVRQFLFGADDVTTSHVLSVGWTHSMTPLAALTLNGGPRVSDGVPAPELSASLRYHVRPGDLVLTYSRGQTTLVGLPGTVDTHGLAATAIYRPRRTVHIRIAPGMYRSVRSGITAQVYRAAVGVACPIGRGLLFDAAYDMNFQRGDIYASRAGNRIARHVVQIRVVASPTARRK
jgi:hypothetical protein